MGLDTASVKFLCAARSLGLDFTRTAMIGRQSFYPDAGSLKRVFSVLGIDHDAESLLRENEFSERFFELLGAKEVASLDYSTYENATVIHDMNAPIPSELKQRFSVVHDGGTIEHVFNIPQAFKNCMEMVAVGGHFTQVNVANNYMGHGFWQVSPELLFRIFSPPNGFQTEAVLLHEVVPGGAWYVVADPDQVRARVELCNSNPTYVMTIAKRIASTEIFATPPLQSDYVALWDTTLNPPPERVFPAPTGWRKYVPRPVKEAAKSALRGMSLLDGKPKLKRGFGESCYRQIDEEVLLHGRLGESLPTTPARISPDAQ
ncbi:MAG: hypothetical protein WD872_08035 [Pirellulaceae bacterium]